MKYKRLLFALILLVLTIGAVSAGDSNSTDETVSDTLELGDENSNLEAGRGTFTALNQSIAKSSTVTLYNDYEYDSTEDSELFGGISIDKDMTIKGNNHVIYSNSARTFVISENSKVTINDLKIVGLNQNKFYSGGAIFNMGSLTLNNCTIENSTVARTGGAIYNSNLLSIINCHFNYNTIKVVDDEDEAIGGAIYNTKTLVSIGNWFTENSAQFGGAIADMGTSSILNTNFYMNIARASGGAIYNNRDTKCYVNDSVFMLNKAKFGGALYKCDAVSCVFLANTADYGNNMLWGSADNCTESRIDNDYVNVTMLPEYNKKVTITQSGNYKNDKMISIKVVDKNGDPVAYEEMDIFIFKENNMDEIYLTDFEYTLSNGIATYRMNLNPGNYVVASRCADEDSNIAILTNVKISKKSVTLKPTKLTTTYQSGKSFAVKVVDNNNKPVSGVTVKLKVYTGKKYKTVTLTTNSKGIAYYGTSSLAVGSHKVVISVGTGFSAKSVSSSIKINPKKLKIITHTSASKDSSLLVCGIYDNGAKMFLNKVNVQVKVFTGKKAKTFNLVSGPEHKLVNSNGICGIQTNKFSAGTHKVKIIVKGPKYTGSATTKLVIKKSAKKYPQFSYAISNGVGRYVK